MRRAALLLAVSTVAGCLTPLGLKGLLLPLTFRDSTAYIVEWQATKLWDPYTIGLTMLVLGIAYCWVRGTLRVPRSEMFWIISWAVFAMPATRNVAAAVIMMAPLVAHRMGTHFSMSRATTSARERTVLTAVLAAVAVAGSAWSVSAWLRTDPLSDAKPLKIARALAAEPGEKRVFNSYNTSGVLLAFGGPDIRLAIDGRSDRYGDNYIGSYIQAENLTGKWQKVFRPVRADYAVIGKRTALAYELRTHQGWTLVMMDRQYVLLKRP